MALRDVYETGFDEQSDKYLSATCPECNSTVIADAGERRCTDCGLVITEQRLDRGTGGIPTGLQRPVSTWPARRSG